MTAIVPRAPGAVRAESPSSAAALVRRPAVAAAAVGALAALLAAALFQHAFVTPDSVYALIWGRELAHLDLTSFSPGPTPHPLPIVAGALTSLLGANGSYLATYALFGPVALGVLAGAVFAAGRLLGSPLTGVLAALVVITSPPVLRYAAAARYDVLFAALVMSAVALELARPKRGAPTLGLLAAAGLIRPEAWLVAGAYWLWIVPSLPPRMRVLTAGLVGLAPVVWMAMDAIVTGDALWSIHYTEAANSVYWKHTAGDTLAQGARDLGAYVGLPALALGALALVRRPRAGRVAMAPLWGLLALTLVMFLVYVVRGVASSDRYLIVPACLVAVAAACAATAWSGRARPLIAVGCALMLLQVLGRVDAPAAAGDALAASVQRVDEVEVLARRPEVASLMRTCPTVASPWAAVHLWSYFSGRAPSRWTIDDRARSRPDVYVVSDSGSTGVALLEGERLDDGSLVIPPSLRAGPAYGGWRLYVSGTSPCVADALGDRR